MSDEHSDDVDGIAVPEGDRPRPRPRTGEDGEASAPMSATARARRIGGRPALTDQAATTELPARRPAPSATVEAARATTPSRPATAPQPAKQPKPPKQPKQRAPRSQGSDAAGAGVAWIPAGVLGLVVVVLLVLIGIASHGVYWDKTSVSSSQRNTTQQAALAAAKTCVATINTYDYRKLPAAETAALACVTGKLTSDLKSVYSQKLTPEAPAAKATQTAQVNQAGVRDVGPDGKQIDVLVFGQLTVTNVSTASTSPQLEPFGVVATMNDVNGKWLVSKLSADVGGSVGS